MDFLSPLPPAGEDAAEYLPDKQLFLRHGSSLAVISQVSKVLNDSKDFEDKDPTEDWESWQQRGDAFSLYFAALFDADGRPVAVLRAVLDGMPRPTPPHNKRLIIDYIYVIPAMRSKGLASSLCEFVVNMCAMIGANSYVLALEDSCVYWMSKGFLLEPSDALQARLNIFRDTHLLRQSADLPYTGSPSDLCMRVVHEIHSSSEEEGEGYASDGEQGEDADLARAIAASLS